MLFNWTDNDFWEFGYSSSASLYQKRMNRQHLWSHLSAEGVCCCSLLYTCSGVYISLNCLGFRYKTFMWSYLKIIFNNTGMLLFLIHWMDPPTLIAEFQLELYDSSSRDMFNGYYDEVISWFLLEVIIDPQSITWNCSNLLNAFSFI